MHIVGIAGRHDRLAQLIGHVDDPAQDLLEPLLIDDLIAVDEILIVRQRLQFDVIIEAHDLSQIIHIPRLCHLEHLAVGTGRTDEQIAVHPPLFDLDAGNARLRHAGERRLSIVGEIGRMAERDQLEQFLETGLVACQHDDVLGAHLFEALRILTRLQLIERGDVAQLIEHVQKRLRQHIGIIICAVCDFLVIGDAIGTGDRTQGI